MSKRKYEPTKRITSISDFENSNALWYEVRYSNHFRMWHRGALESLQYHTLKNFIYNDYVYECKRVGGEND